METFLIPEQSVITAKGDGPAVAIEPPASGVVLVTLRITRIVEQEALELSVFGSADGQTWDIKPLLVFPQKFYCGETPMLLDIGAQPTVKYLRAHWEVNRWGRGPEQPMFEVAVSVREVPKEMLAAKA